ncbi:hypothetical protein [Chitinimonas sp. BJB300]|nr:hypothetical protein [Chitinimonas sp. BJB300]
MILPRSRDQGSGATQNPHELKYIPVSVLRFTLLTAARYRL